MYPSIRLAPRMDRLAAASDRIDALMRASHKKRDEVRSNLEGNHPTLSASVNIGAFVHDRILGKARHSLPCTTSC